MNGRSLLESSGSLAPWLIAFRRDLHRHPELSFQESRTAGRVAERLRELGLSPQTGVGGHGVVADIVGGAGTGRVIALRADMDALPIQEEADLEFSSAYSGVMHACGHDAHTAMLLGAAELLIERAQTFGGTVRLLFQAAEEMNAGAKAMIEQGALAGVDEIYGLHNLPTLPIGKAATRFGPMMGSVDRIDMYVEGKGGHGAMPDQSIDPVLCASAIVLGLQSIVSREISPFQPAVVTIGSIKSGEANNVIPHYAELTGTVRTFDAAVQEAMPERIRRIAAHIAESYRCEVKLVYTKQAPVLVNDDSCVKQVEGVIDEIIGRLNRAAAEPTMAGEDFAFYLRQIPGCFFWLGSGPEINADKAYGLHHPKFELHEDCMRVGAALLAGIAVKRLS
jgi:amidohydrolase